MGEAVARDNAAALAADGAGRLAREDATGARQVLAKAEVAAIEAWGYEGPAAARIRMLKGDVEMYMDDCIAAAAAFTEAVAFYAQELGMKGVPRVRSRERGTKRPSRKEKEETELPWVEPLEQPQESFSFTATDPSMILVDEQELALPTPSDARQQRTASTAVSAATLGAAVQKEEYLAGLGCVAYAYYCAATDAGRTTPDGIAYFLSASEFYTRQQVDAKALDLPALRIQPLADLGCVYIHLGRYQAAGAAFAVAAQHLDGCDGEMDVVEDPSASIPSRTELQGLRAIAEEWWRRLLAFRAGAAIFWAVRRFLRRKTGPAPPPPPAEHHDAARRIQALHRGNAGRRRARDTHVEQQQRHGAAVKIQALHRGRCARAETARMRDDAAEMEEHAAAVKIQAVQRGHRARAEYAAQQKDRRAQNAAAVRIQALLRGKAGRRAAQAAREEQLLCAAAAVKIQALHRGNAGRTAAVERRERLAKEHQAATVLQARARGAAGRKAYRHKHAVHEKEQKAATKVQALTRGRIARNEAVALRAQKEAERVAAVKIQARQRGARDRQVVEAKREGLRRHYAAQKIQAVHRGKEGRRAAQLNREERAALKIQALHRGNVGRARWRAEREQRAATKIQAMQRGRIGRQQHADRAAEHSRRHAAATKIQSRYRGNRAREEASAKAARRREVERRMKKRAALSVGKELKALQDAPWDPADQQKPAAAPACDGDGGSSPPPLTLPLSQGVAGLPPTSSTLAPPNSAAPAPLAAGTGAAGLKQWALTPLLSVAKLKIKSNVAAADRKGHGTGERLLRKQEAYEAALARRDNVLRDPVALAAVDAELRDLELDPEEIRAVRGYRVLKAKREQEAAELDKARRAEEEKCAKLIKIVDAFNPHAERQRFQKERRRMNRVAAITSTIADLEDEIFDYEGKRRLEIEDMLTFAEVPFAREPPPPRKKDENDDASDVTERTAAAKAKKKRKASRVATRRGSAVVSATPRTTHRTTQRGTGGEENDETQTADTERTQRTARRRLSSVVTRTRSEGDLQAMQHRHDVLAVRVDAKLAQEQSLQERLARLDAQSDSEAGCAGVNIVEEGITDSSVFPRAPKDAFSSSFSASSPTGSPLTATTRRRSSAMYGAVSQRRSTAVSVGSIGDLGVSKELNALNDDSRAAVARMDKLRGELRELYNRQIEVARRQRDGEHAAATKIQARHRGNQARERHREMQKQWCRADSRGASLAFVTEYVSLCTAIAVLDKRGDAVALEERTRLVARREALEAAPPAPRPPTASSAGSAERPQPTAAEATHDFVKAYVTAIIDAAASTRSLCMVPLEADRVGVAERTLRVKALECEGAAVEDRGDMLPEGFVREYIGTVVGYAVATKDDEGVPASVAFVQDCMAKVVQDQRREQATRVAAARRESLVSLRRFMSMMGGDGTLEALRLVADLAGSVGTSRPGSVGTQMTQSPRSVVSFAGTDGEAVRRQSWDALGHLVDMLGGDAVPAALHMLAELGSVHHTATPAARDALRSAGSLCRSLPSRATSRASEAMNTSWSALGRLLDCMGPDAAVSEALRTVVALAENERSQSAGSRMTTPDDASSVASARSESYNALAAMVAMLGEDGVPEALRMVAVLNAMETRRQSSARSGRRSRPASSVASWDALGEMVGFLGEDSVLDALRTVAELGAAQRRRREPPQHSLDLVLRSADGDEACENLGLLSQMRSEGVRGDTRGRVDKKRRVSHAPAEVTDALTALALVLDHAAPELTSLQLLREQQRRSSRRPSKRRTSFVDIDANPIDRDRPRASAASASATEGSWGSAWQPQMHMSTEEHEYLLGIVAEAHRLHYRRMVEWQLEVRNEVRDAEEREDVKLALQHFRSLEATTKTRRRAARRQIAEVAGGSEVTTECTSMACGHRSSVVHFPSDDCDGFSAKSQQTELTRQQGSTLAVLSHLVQQHFSAAGAPTPPWALGFLAGSLGAQDGARDEATAACVETVAGLVQQSAERGGEATPVWASMLGDAITVSPTSVPPTEPGSPGRPMSRASHISGASHASGMSMHSQWDGLGYIIGLLGDVAPPPLQAVAALYAEEKAEREKAEREKADRDLSDATPRRARTASTAASTAPSHTSWDALAMLADTLGADFPEALRAVSELETQRRAERDDMGKPSGGAPATAPLCTEADDALASLMEMLGEDAPAALRLVCDLKSAPVPSPRRASAAASNTSWDALGALADMLGADAPDALRTVAALETQRRGAHPANQAPAVASTHGSVAERAGRPPGEEEAQLREHMARVKELLAPMGRLVRLLEDRLVRLGGGEEADEAAARGDCLDGAVMGDDDDDDDEGTDEEVDDATDKKAKKKKVKKKVKKKKKKKKGEKKHSTATTASATTSVLIARAEDELAALEEEEEDREARRVQLREEFTTLMLTQPSMRAPPSPHAPERGCEKDDITTQPHATEKADVVAAGAKDAVEASESGASEGAGQPGMALLQKRRSTTWRDEERAALEAELMALWDDPEVDEYYDLQDALAGHREAGKEGAQTVSRRVSRGSRRSSRVASIAGSSELPSSELTDTPEAGADADAIILTKDLLQRYLLTEGGEYAAREEQLIALRRELADLEANADRSAHRALLAIDKLKAPVVPPPPQGVSLEDRRKQREARKENPRGYASYRTTSGEEYAKRSVAMKCKERVVQHLTAWRTRKAQALAKDIECIRASLPTLQSLLAGVDTDADAAGDSEEGDYWQARSACHEEFLSDLEAELAEVERVYQMRLVACDADPLRASEPLSPTPLRMTPREQRAGGAVVAPKDAWDDVTLDRAMDLVATCEKAPNDLHALHSLCFPSATAGRGGNAEDDADAGSQDQAAYPNYIGVANAIAREAESPRTSRPADLLKTYPARRGASPYREDAFGNIIPKTHAAADVYSASMSATLGSYLAPVPPPPSTQQGGQLVYPLPPPRQGWLGAKVPHRPGTSPDGASGPTQRESPLAATQPCDRGRDVEETPAAALPCLPRGKMTPVEHLQACWDTAADVPVGCDPQALAGGHRFPLRKACPAPSALKPLAAFTSTFAAAFPSFPPPARKKNAAGEEYAHAAVVAKAEASARARVVNRYEDWALDTQVRLSRHLQTLQLAAVAHVKQAGQAVRVLQWVARGVAARGAYLTKPMGDTLDATREATASTADPRDGERLVSLGSSCVSSVADRGPPGDGPSRGSSAPMVSSLTEGGGEDDEDYDDDFEAASPAKQDAEGGAARAASPASSLTCSDLSDSTASTPRTPQPPKSAAEQRRDAAAASKRTAAAALVGTWVRVKYCGNTMKQLAAQLTEARRKHRPPRGLLACFSKAGTAVRVTPTGNVVIKYMEAEPTPPPAALGDAVAYSDDRCTGLCVVGAQCGLRELTVPPELCEAVDPDKPSGIPALRLPNARALLTSDAVHAAFCHDTAAALREECQRQLEACCPQDEALARLRDVAVDAGVTSAGGIVLPGDAPLDDDVVSAPLEGLEPLSPASAFATAFDEVKYLMKRLDSIEATASAAVGRVAELVRAVLTASRVSPDTADQLNRALRPHMVDAFIAGAQALARAVHSARQVVLDPESVRQTDVLSAYATRKLMTYLAAAPPPKPPPFAPHPPVPAGLSPCRPQPPKREDVAFGYAPLGVDSAGGVYAPGADLARRVSKTRPSKYQPPKWAVEPQQTLRYVRPQFAKEQRPGKPEGRRHPSQQSRIVVPTSPTHAFTARPFPPLEDAFVNSLRYYLPDAAAPDRNVPPPSYWNGAASPRPQPYLRKQPRRKGAAAGKRAADTLPALPHAGKGKGRQARIDAVDQLDEPVGVSW